MTLRLKVTAQESHACQERMGVRQCTESDNLYACYEKNLKTNCEGDSLVDLNEVNFGVAPDIAIHSGSALP